MPGAGAVHPIRSTLAYRWFCDLGLEDTIPGHSAFSRARNDRFRERDPTHDRAASDGGRRVLLAPLLGAMTFRPGERRLPPPHLDRRFMIIAVSDCGPRSERSRTTLTPVINALGRYRALPSVAVKTLAVLLRRHVLDQNVPNGVAHISALLEQDSTLLRGHAEHAFPGSITT